MSEQPRTTNQVSDTIAGAIVQAGTVSGGLHVHLAPPDKLVTRQLPSAPRAFTGRDQEISRLVDS